MIALKMPLCARLKFYLMESRPSLPTGFPQTFQRGKQYGYTIILTNSKHPKLLNPFPGDLFSGKI
jgi:hypothetical protein